MKTKQVSRRFAPVLAILIGALVIGSAQAAENAAKPSKPAMSESDIKARAQEFRQAQTRMRELQQKLQVIQQEAVKADSDLQKERQDLQNMLVDTMKKQGFDPMKSMNRMQQLRQKMQGKDLSTKDKRELATKYRAEQQQFVAARKKAFGDKKVDKARESYKNKLLAAMKKVEPKTDDMLKELAQIEAKLRAMYRQQKGSNG